MSSAAFSCAPAWWSACPQVLAFGSCFLGSTVRQYVGRAARSAESHREQCQHVPRANPYNDAVGMVRANRCTVVMGQRPLDAATPESRYCSPPPPISSPPMRCDMINRSSRGAKAEFAVIYLLLDCRLPFMFAKLISKVGEACVSLLSSE